MTRIIDMTDILQSMVLVASHINKISVDAKNNRITDWNRWSEKVIIELQAIAAMKELDVDFVIDLFVFISKYIVSSSKESE